MSRYARARRFATDPRQLSYCFHPPLSVVIVDAADSVDAARLRHLRHCGRRGLVARALAEIACDGRGVR